MRKTVLTLMLAASAITSAGAQTAPATPRPPMRQDANHDGVSTRAEAIAQADARFAQMDTDHDGRITTGEMRAYREALHDRMVASGRDVPVPPPGGRKHDGMGRRMDPNGDGSVTREEFEARALKRFDRMDANHDGTIDATERANAAEIRHVDRRERRDGGTQPAPAPAQ
ncbi:MULTISPECIES: EF-hand domain-containing protein [unclassified Sphingomonas]|uniref:EF-hand domain-containing protein n=1 Tax=unclassified Sphingomonas TaxID=196159 RepID=UPI000FF29758|nr:MULTISPECIES: EF-hand domain-containing protein [unclassified Sphingomonas]RKE53422.1 EF hand domain-containing protein [Sphingomonas sp. PP-CC-1A-547]TCM09917.1 EF hand domain-containing protein [Sphingomonas sp. PP-CC-3G-468]